MSILYLRRSRFRIVLRGKDVEHHNIVNDLMLTQEITYKPTGSGADGLTKDTNVSFRQNIFNFHGNLQYYLASMLIANYLVNRWLPS